MKNKDLLLVPDLREMLAADDSEALRSFCESGHPAVIAEFISDMSGQEAWTVLLHAVPALRSEIFSHLDEDLQVEIIGSLRREEVARLLAEMSPDDRADLFKQLPEDLRESVLPALAQAEREDIRRLSSYSEGTAGAVMTSDYASLASASYGLPGHRAPEGGRPRQGDDLLRICRGRPPEAPRIRIAQGFDNCPAGGAGKRHHAWRGHLFPGRG